MSIQLIRSVASSRSKRLVLAGLVGAGSLGLAGAASADTHHEGPPPVWGPAKQVLCNNPGMGPGLGYNVIISGAAVVVGTPQADLIITGPGNDSVDGRAGDDVLCLGTGNDRGRGGPGNDAVFGQEGNDKLQGNGNDDWLDGGPGNDRCDGGPHNIGDAAVNCEFQVNVFP